MINNLKTSVLVASTAIAMGFTVTASAATYIDYSGNLNDVNALTGYNKLVNVNGDGATQNSIDFGKQRIGLNTATSGTQVGSGAQYHYIFTNVDQAVGGTTGTIYGNDYSMMDPMMPGGYHLDPFTEEPTGFLYDHAASGVGQLSWCQAGECAGGTGTSIGWNHTSNHILFSLSQDSAVEITLSNAAEDLTKHGPNEESGMLGADLIPAFTIYSGVSTTGNNDGNHTFNNMQNPWTNVTYLDHDANDANASSITWMSDGLLAAGYYSLWIGGNYANVANIDGSHGKNYALNITAAPVPLPAAAWLFAPALTGLGAIGRRKKVVA